jgi:hypothetical protein
VKKVTLFSRPCQSHKNFADFDIVDVPGIPRHLGFVETNDEYLLSG